MTLLHRAYMMAAVATLTQLPACTSMSQCDGMSSILARSECRTKVATDRDLAVETVGALLITGAKYAYTRSIRSHEHIDPLVNLFTHNKASATEEYARFLLQKSNHNPSIALSLLIKNQETDILELSKVVDEFVKDADNSLNEIKKIERNQYNRKQLLTKRADNLRSISKKVDELDAKAPLYQEALEVYPIVADLIAGPQRLNRDVSSKLEILKKTNSRTSTEVAGWIAYMNAKKFELHSYGLI